LIFAFPDPDQDAPLHAIAKPRRVCVLANVTPAAPAAPTPAPLTDVLPHRAFRVALLFLLVAALLGVLLRWQLVAPVPGLVYGYWLHAHSHTAFLGFVFNAFFGLALVRFVPSGETRVYARLFVVLQIAVLGMLATFPWQGYAAASIAFSTLHMGGAGVFAWRLWRHNHASPAALPHLRASLFFLLLSGLGPLALGPLAATGMREHPAYSLSIYFYLHAQYNGWFPFFLQACALQQISAHTTSPTFIRHSSLAHRWFLAGVLLTFAQSTLWLAPPAWVYVAAALGGLAQLIGFAYLLRALVAARPLPAGPIRLLVLSGVAAFALKLGLQAASAWPALSALVSHRYVVIAFLHLVFLGVVAPVVFAAGIHAGWLRDRLATRIGLVVFFSAAALSELILVFVALGWSPPLPINQLLLASAIGMALATAPLFAASVRR
jgi:hypothetical protein